MVNLFWRPEPWRVQFPSSISDMGFSGNILPWDLIVHQFIHPSFSLFEYGLWGFNPFSDTPISLSLYVYIYICIHIMYLPIYLKKKHTISSLHDGSIHQIPGQILHSHSQVVACWVTESPQMGFTSFFTRTLIVLPVNLAPNFRSKNPILKQW